MVFVELINLTPFSVLPPTTLCSESEVVVDGFFVSANIEADLGTCTPFFNAELLCLFSFCFGKKIELRVQLLGFVLKLVNTKFVVVSVLVFPLIVGLDIQNLHEGANLNIREVVTQTGVGHVS